MKILIKYGGWIFPKGRFPMTLMPRDFTKCTIPNADFFQGGLFPRALFSKVTFPNGDFYQGGLFPRVLFPTFLPGIIFTLQSIAEMFFPGR